ncbi:hypothetical protein AGDE_12107 [Angomonas deanei]|uniref:Uncharacterized protein n=1 Tax=Angomonas deanei TaxID=59799 RepID=A0A7G2CFG4_9TRYP|nr:hypothetical protein AGDE_12107 [Angomonas deanei]CAD2216882.1 hypothetical protein, conserved [Angomonas deanei]|eukprot:EPY24917.1 hypothetical protein AGDE_12107 [Angomonas deanei]
MFKILRILRQGSQPDMHRYAQATFHEGTHRMAPGDSSPWRDASSPVNRIKGWWLAPAAKGSVIAAWCVTFVLGTYCFSIQQDAKGTYLLNNVLLRNLHEESQRADANQQRAAELQEAMKQHLSQHEKNKKTNDKIKEYKSSLEEVKAGIVNYELELAREKLRADTNHERSQNLVNELIAVRQQIAALQKDNKILTQEIERLRKSSH